MYLKIYQMFLASKVCTIRNMVIFWVQGANNCIHVVHSSQNILRPNLLI